MSQNLDAANQAAGPEEEVKQPEAPIFGPIPGNLDAIDITDIRYNKESFYIPPRFKPYIENVVIPEGMLLSRWDRLAERILSDYAQENELVIIVLMSGGLRFYEDLKERLSHQI